MVGRVSRPTRLVLLTALGGLMVSLAITTPPLAASAAASSRPSAAASGTPSPLPRATTSPRPPSTPSPAPSTPSAPPSRTPPSTAAATPPATPAAPAAPPAGPSGGVVLDVFGGLHPFGALGLNTGGAPYWSGWSIARSASVRPDGGGGWTLDGYGGVHRFGGAGPIDAPAYGPDPSARSPAYWGGWDIARSLVVLPDGRSGYMLDGFGGIHRFGSAPQIPGTSQYAAGDPATAGPYWHGWDIARGLDVILDPSGTVVGGAVLDAYGDIHPFGGYPTDLHNVYHHGSDAYLSLHRVGGEGYTVGRFGIVRGVSPDAATGFSPNWSGYADFGGGDYVRDVILVGQTGTPSAEPSSFLAGYDWQSLAEPQRGVVTLDGWGGLHATNGLAVNSNGAPYWQGWDIARALALLPDGGGGWTLDGYGGIHSWGGAPPVNAPQYGADPNARALAYWPGWDFARDLAVLPDHRSGYVLDGWGGIHAFGGAPQIPGTWNYASGDPGFTAAYWRGWDFARSLTVHLDANGLPDGGVVLDGFGGLHPFGNAAGLNGGQYWAGRDWARKLRLTSLGHSFELGGWGMAADTSGGQARPYWSGYSDWGGWNIQRDMQFVGADDNSWPVPQPVSGAAINASIDLFWTYSLNVAPVAQQMPLDCETAALQEALLVKGVNVSQSRLMGYEPLDTRGAAVSNGNVLRWGDPYTNFVGDVYGSEGNFTGYGTYAPVIGNVGSIFGRPTQVISGGNINQVFDAVAHGNAVVIWTSNTFQSVGMRTWTAWDGRAVPYALTEHAVTVVAVNHANRTVTIDDVGDGRNKTFSVGQFESFWSSFGNMAVVVG